MNHPCSSDLQSAQVGTSGPLVLPTPTLAALAIHLVNLQPDDLRFLQGVIATFTDPARGAHLQSLRSGHVGILYGPGGKADLHLTHRTAFGNN